MKLTGIYCQRRNLLRAATVFTAVAMSFFYTSCNRQGKQYGTAVSRRDSTAVMTTRGVSMLISENGVVRYRVIAEEWAVYDSLTPPRNIMEKGLKLELLDSLMQVEAWIESDTAYNYYSKDQWELRHDVHAENVKNEKFDTQQLYWDNRRGMIWSDSLIRIEQADQIIIGRGFESNSNMTEYTIRKTEGVFPIKDE